MSGSAAGDQAGRFTEIEAKVPCGDSDAVRRRLRAAGARRVTSGLEHNVVFDTADGALARTDCLLRLRTHNGCLLTWKGPRAGGSTVKERSEAEVEVSNFEAAERFLAGLGYRRVWVYEKIREKWILGAVKVALDELPRVGSFVEVEAGVRDEIVGALSKLGLDVADSTARTYAEIWRDYLAGLGEPFEDMVFEKKEQA